jgi:hypothetical protein
MAQFLLKAASMACHQVNKRRMISAWLLLLLLLLLLLPPPPLLLLMLLLLQLSQRTLQVCSTSKSRARMNALNGLQVDGQRIVAVAGVSKPHAS